MNAQSSGLHQSYTALPITAPKDIGVRVRRQSRQGWGIGAQVRQWALVHGQCVFMAMVS